MSKQYLNGVPYGVSMPYRELTQAEYDALPDSKNNNGIMYFIKNAGVAGGIKMFALADVYDTSEREIGVWIDGKPVYQKVIDCNFTINSNNWYNTQIACPDFDILVFGRAIDSDNQSWDITVGRYTSPSKTIGIRMAIFDNNGSNLKKLIVRYTKTTDVAGSGSLTPQGTPTHHYSTDEHVIGTWIDGKPLYEKVFVKSYIEGDVNISSCHVDALINCFGTMLKPSTNQLAFPYYLSSSDYAYIYYDKEYETLHYEVSSGSNQQSTYRIIIQYTKTTD